MTVRMVPKMQYRSHNLVFQPDHLAMHIKISHKKESNASDLYKCLTNNSLRERGKNIMHKKIINICCLIQRTYLCVLNICTLQFAMKYSLSLVSEERQTAGGVTDVRMFFI